MEFRRSGQRDDRRRRVRLDERIGSGEARQPALAVRSADRDEAHPPLAGKTYHEAACADRQWRVTDLIPTRFGTFFVLVLVGVAAIVGIEALYGQHGEWSRTLGDTAVAAFDPTGPASVAAWFSSFLLGLAAATSLMIYSIRRHKEDDYRGRYRIWVWAAVVWLLGSMAAVAPLHPLVAAVIAHVSGTKLIGSPVVFSSSFYAMILVTVAVPVAVDMFQSRVALTALLVAGGAYLIGVAIDLGLLATLAGPLQTMCLSTARLTSHLMLLVSLLLFARHVYLDAQGMIAARPARRRRTKRVRTRREENRAARQPKLRVVSDDLGDTVTEAPEPEVPQRNSRSAAAEDDAGRTTSLRKKRKSKTLSRSSSSRAKDDVDDTAADEPDAPHVVKVPSISKKSVAAGDGSSDEIARLEAIEPHLLTKAQRRRLRKLQRRSGRKAA